MSSRASVWLRDPSTYPLLACISAGAAMCATVGIRHLTKSPDVKLNRELRMNPDQAMNDEESPSNWVAHRNRMRNLGSNAINKHNDDYIQKYR